MAQKTWFLLNGLAQGATPNLHMDLVEASTAPTASTTGTGWTVGKLAAGSMSTLQALNERATSTFKGAQPTGNLLADTGDCFMTEYPLYGTFASGTWNLLFGVTAVTAGSDQDGRFNFKFWKGADASGVGATSLAGVQTTTSVLNVNVNSISVCQNIAYNPGSWTFNGEFFFCQVAWEITGAGGGNTRDILIQVGSNTQIITSDFQPSVGAPDTVSYGATIF